MTAGGCGLYATTADLARYAAALLGGGRGDHGQVVKPDTLASMFRPHFQLDPRAPGWGLGFELGDEGGHRLVRHSGIVSGFLSDMVLAPDAGLGVVVLANTGGLDGRGAPELLAPALLRRLLGLPENAIRRGQLLLKPLTPIPALRGGLRLYADDPDDPQVFRVDLSAAGKPPTRVVFSRDPDAEGAVMRLLMLGMSLQKRPDVRNPRPWVLKGRRGHQALPAA